MTTRGRWRVFKRLFVGGGIVFLAVALTMIALGWRAFGKGATGERLVRMEKSKQWDGSKFENPLPLWNDASGMFRTGSEHASPASRIAPFRPTAQDFEAPADLRITWLGHSTTIIELEGTRLLTDPVWGPRSSPYEFIGPMRWYAPPIPLEKMPKIDAVLISHDHYDHLDMRTIEAIKDWDTQFLAPLGVGAHLAYWGIPPERINEYDWWERTTVNGLEIVCTPARHASGRQVFDQNATLWAGWAILGKNKRVFFSGDTGIFPEMADIGKQLGPFDLTMIEAGAYDRAWPDWHIGPEQAIEAHGLLRGKVLMPIHWGLFDLALHGWTEPVERIMAAATKTGARVVTPRPGMPLVVTSSAATERWWPEVPWMTAEENPVLSTGIDDRRSRLKD